MLTRIFGQINSATHFMVGFYALVLAMGHIFFHQEINLQLQTAFGKVYVLPIMGYMLAGVLFAVLAFAYQWLWFTRFKLVNHHAYIPVVLLPILLINTGDDALVLLAHLVLLVAVFKTWLDVYQGQNVLQQGLNTGFLLGLGSMLDVQYGLLLFFTYLVYIIFGRISFRTVLIPLIGYLTIWFIALLLDYLLLDSTFVMQQFSDHFGLTPRFELDTANWPRLLMLAILFLAGLSQFIITASRAAVFKRQSFTLFFILLILAVIAYFFAGNSPLQLALIIALLTLLAVNYLQYIKKAWKRELFLWTILVLFGIFESGVL
jgi:hypothetical protein